jgi:hypothetical protein
MAHQHFYFCADGGHAWQCDSSACMCFCDVPMEQGDPTECPVELRAGQQHQDGLTPAEEESIEEAGAVPIQFPHDIQEKLSRVMLGSKRYEGLCIWCGYGYEMYNPKLEAEHFAYACPDAPEQLKDNFRQRLSGRATNGKRRCRKDATSKNLNQESASFGW